MSRNNARLTAHASLMCTAHKHKINLIPEMAKSRSLMGDDVMRSVWRLLLQTVWRLQVIIFHSNHMKMISSMPFAKKKKKTQPKRAHYTCSGMGSNLPRPLSASSTASSNVSGSRVWRVSGRRDTSRPEVMEIAPNIVSGNQPLTVFCKKGTTRRIILKSNKSTGRMQHQICQ